MKDSLALTVVTWFALLCIMALCAWHLADGFAPEYPEEGVSYTESSYSSMAYKYSQCQQDKTKAMEFIRSVADGNIR